jgi:hypothetical protein
MVGCTGKDIDEPLVLVLVLEEKDSDALLALSEKDRDSDAGSEEVLNEDEADAGKEETIVEAGTTLKEKEAVEMNKLNLKTIQSCSNIQPEAGSEELNIPEVDAEPLKDWDIEEGPLLKENDAGTITGAAIGRAVKIMTGAVGQSEGALWGVRVHTGAVHVGTTTGATEGVTVGTADGGSAGGTDGSIAGEAVTDATGATGGSERVGVGTSTGQRVLFGCGGRLRFC